MFMYKFKNDKRGMTLIEMIISLVILSILMTSTMGMISSSMSIFTSTSEASIDRMVGNSVYSTMENALRFATKVKISDEPDTQTLTAAFYIANNADAGTEAPSGKLMYRRGDVDGNGEITENEDYHSMFDESKVYKNRTIQYQLVPIESKFVGDGRHVRLLVNVFRNGKKVFTKNSVIKCVNLNIVANPANGITFASGPISYNQYIYFSNDSLLLAGGADAWSMEFMINEYMNRYNAIQRAYFNDFNVANHDLNNLVVGNEDLEGKRVVKSDLEKAINLRNTAIFGNVSGHVHQEYKAQKKADNKRTDDINGCKNLRQYYRNEIEDLLKFKPTRAGLAESNPFEGIVATKEELYTGFMLTYFDKNRNGSIEKNEYPKFSDDGFFDGTVLKNYNGANNGVKVLCYFRDNMHEDFKEICTEVDPPAGKKIYTYEAKGATTSKQYVSNRPDYAKKYTGIDSTGFDESTAAVQGQSDYLCRSFRASFNNVTSADLYYDYACRYKALYKYTPNFSELTQNKSAEDAGGRANAVLGLYTESLVNDHTNSLFDNKEYTRSTAIGPRIAKMLDAKPLSFNKDEFKPKFKLEGDYEGSEISTFVATAPENLTEGWYYFKEKDHRRFWIPPHWDDDGTKHGGSWIHGEDVYNYYFFYLEADRKSSEDDLKKSGILLDNGEKIAATAGSRVYLYINKEYGPKLSENAKKANTARFYTYERAIPGTQDTGISHQYVKLYVPKCHQYEDYILYGVDWNSWFNTTQQGLLNKLISGVPNWWGGRKNITKISANNAEQSLGLTGIHNINNNSYQMRSFNMFWLVFDSHRGNWYYLPANSNMVNSAWSGITWTSDKNSPVPLNLKSWNFNSSSVNAYIEMNMIPKDEMLGLISVDRDARWVPLPTGGGIDRNEIPTVPEDPVTP